MCTCITKLHPDVANSGNDNFEDNKFTGDSIQIENVNVMTNMLNRKTLAFLVVVVAATLPLTAYATEYDIAINNGRVMDPEPRGRGIDTIRLIMKDGKIYKNTL